MERDENLAHIAGLMVRHFENDFYFTLPSSLLYTSVNFSIDFTLGNLCTLIICPEPTGDACLPRWCPETIKP
jgi:hypothetical protein